MKKAIFTLFAAFAASSIASARIIELDTASSSCRIDLNGARIVSFKTGGREVLWNDYPPQTSAKDWAHGGIPVCWPRFGVDETGAIHGFLWRRTPEMRRIRKEAERSELVLEFSEAGVRLQYAIVLTDSLTLELTTFNMRTNAFACSFGFHPYFRVAERSKVRVDGLDGLQFEDDPSCLKPERGRWSGDLTLTKSIDRIFRLPEGRRCVFTAYDAAGGRQIAVSSEGASHVNVWNPGPEKNCPGVVPGDEWRRFACVEPVFMGGTDGSPVPIPPGGRRKLKMTVSAGLLKGPAAK